MPIIEQVDSRCLWCPAYCVSVLLHPLLLHQQPLISTWEDQHPAVVAALRMRRIPSDTRPQLGDRCSKTVIRGRGQGWGEVRHYFR